MGTRIEATPVRARYNPNRSSFGRKLAWSVPLLAVIALCLYGGLYSILALVILAAAVGAGEFTWRVMSNRTRAGRTRQRWIAVSAVLAGALPLAGWAWPSYYWMVLIGSFLAFAHLRDGLVARSENFTRPARESRPSKAALEGAFLIGGTLGSFIPVAQTTDATQWILLIVLFNVVSDSASLICGQLMGRLFDALWGKHRVRRIRPPCPKLSPHKTWSGFIGGWAFTAGLGITLSAYTANPTILWLGLTIGVTAPLGDLFGSLLKRSLAIKDWSGLLGPHGGVNDRADSFTFSAPAGYLVILAAGLI